MQKALYQTGDEESGMSLYQTADTEDQTDDLYKTANAGDHQTAEKVRMQESLYQTADAGDTLYQTADAGDSLSDSGCRRLSYQTADDAGDSSIRQWMKKIRQRMQESPSDSECRRHSIRQWMQESFSDSGCIRQRMQ